MPKTLEAHFKIFEFWLKILKIFGLEFLTKRASLMTTNHHIRLRLFDTHPYGWSIHAAAIWWDTKTKFHAPNLPAQSATATSRGASISPRSGCM